MEDPELIIENLNEEMPEREAGADADQEAGGTVGTKARKAAAADKAEEADNGEREAKRSRTATLKQLKEQASEGDDAPVGTLTMKQILGGDYLLTLTRNYAWFLILVMMLTCVYVGVRYQCQQDIIEISRLEKELEKAKFRAMSSSSNLTELCRQSNVIKVLEGLEDNKLKLPEQPPYIIDVKEE